MLVHLLITEQYVSSVWNTSEDTPEHCELCVFIKTKVIGNLDVTEYRTLSGFPIFCVNKKKKLLWFQLDIELSFCRQEHVMMLVEDLLEHSWLAEQKVTTPFQRMTYAEAMENYGSDKPDLRFEWKVWKTVILCLLFLWISIFPDLVKKKQKKKKKFSMMVRGLLALLDEISNN